MKFGTSVSLPLEMVVWLKNKEERTSDIIEKALKQTRCMATVLLAIQDQNLSAPIESHLSNNYVPFINVCTTDVDDIEYSYETMMHECKYVVFHVTNSNNGLNVLNLLDYSSSDKVVILAQNLTEEQLLDLAHRQYQWFYSVEDVIYFLRSKILLPKR